MNPYQHITKIRMKKCTDAQLSLQNALISLNQHRAINTITVKDLCQQAHVARSTFYSYYDNVMQLQEEIEDNLLYQLLQLNDNLKKMPVGEDADFTFLQNVFEFMQQNKQVFYAFLIAAPNVQFISKWKEAIKYHFWERFFRNMSQKNERLILEAIASQAITMYAFWLQNPYEVDIDSLNKLILKVLEVLI